MLSDNVGLHLLFRGRILPVLYAIHLSYFQTLNLSKLLSNANKILLLHSWTHCLSVDMVL